MKIKKRHVLPSIVTLFLSMLLMYCTQKDDPKATPSIASFNPSSGPFGASVTITGNNFSTVMTNNTVIFNGADATVTAATTTQLTVTVPMGGATGKISVVVEGLTATSSNDFTVDNTPSISSFSPSSGMIGSSIIVTGTNFSSIAANNFVSFNGVNGTVVAATATQLTVSVPNGAKTGKLSLSVNGLSCVSANSFTLTAPTISNISPTSGSKWTPVTITGSGFDSIGANDSIFFNGKRAILVSASSTQIVVKVVPGSTTGPVSIRMNGTSSAGPIFTYVQTVTVSTLAGNGVQAFANGTGTAASFMHPSNITIDSSGNLYVADETDNMIRKITPEGVVTTFAGSGSIGTVNGAGSTASFYNPVDVDMDANGNFYVADSFNQLIRKISSTGVVSTLAGNGSYGAVNGSGLSASFNNPHGVAIDKTGNVYVADNNNFLVRKITTAGVVSTFAGTNGVSGSINGTGTTATFANVWDVTIDGDGNLYVGTDYSIRKITSGGVVSTLAGSASSGQTDGIGTAASFSRPTGLAVDEAGNIYVADFFNSTIRKITPSGVVTTLAGTANSLGFSNGTGVAATFRNPEGVAVNRAGNILYVADTGNRAIRKIVIE